MFIIAVYYIIELGSVMNNMETLWFSFSVSFLRANKKQHWYELFDLNPVCVEKKSRTKQLIPKFLWNSIHSSFDCLFVCLSGHFTYQKYTF